MNHITQQVSGIYGIVNKDNKNIYIGGTGNISKRVSNHKKQLKKQQHENRFLQKDWNKFGSEKFEAIIIELCDRSQMQEKEQHYIDLYGKSNIVYNIAKFAGSSFGIKRTPETCEKISNSLKGKRNLPADYKHSLETIEKIRKSNTGYHHTEQSKELNRQAHLGKTLSEETKQKIASFQKTQTRSEETRKRISDSKLGTIVSEETKEKLRQANLGKSMSEENKKALQKANIGNKYNLGRKQTEEEKKKRSESAKLFHQNKKKEKKISLILNSIMIPSCELIGYNLNNMTHDNLQVRS
jgi:group I intron endonuclease